MPNQFINPIRFGWPVKLDKGTNHRVVVSLTGLECALPRSRASDPGGEPAELARLRVEHHLRSPTTEHPGQSLVSQSSLVMLSSFSESESVDPLVCVYPHVVEGPIEHVRPHIHFNFLVRCLILFVGLQYRQEPG